MTGPSDTLLEAAAESCSAEFPRQMQLSNRQATLHSSFAGQQQAIDQTALKRGRQRWPPRRNRPMRGILTQARGNQRARSVYLPMVEGLRSTENTYRGRSAAHRSCYALTLRQDEIVSMADAGASCNSAGIVARGLSERD